MVGRTPGRTAGSANVTDPHCQFAYAELEPEGASIAGGKTPKRRGSPACSRGVISQNDFWGVIAEVPRARSMRVADDGAGGSGRFRPNSAFLLFSLDVGLDNVVSDVGRTCLVALEYRA
jgi:hypothetical protein